MKSRRSEFILRRGSVLHRRQSEYHDWHACKLGSRNAGAEGLIGEKVKVPQNFRDSRNTQEIYQKAIKRSSSYFV